MTMKVCSQCGKPMKFEDYDVMVDKGFILIGGVKFQMAPGQGPVHLECLEELMRNAEIVDNT